MNWESSGFDIKYDAKEELNWVRGFDPIGFSCDDAYNTITSKAMELGVDWVFIIEDDVIIPPDTLVKMDRHMRKEKYPVISGLYYLKGFPPEPMVFRGRGNGAFDKFKVGNYVWADGVPMGCLLVHTSILKYLWDHSEGYRTPAGLETRRVFESPRRVFANPETESFSTQVGSQDLYFCDRILEGEVFKKTGWKSVSRKKYPFLVDTSIFCKHIDRNTGRQYP